MIVLCGSTISAQSYYNILTTKGYRPIKTPEMPVEWFETDFKAYTKIEVFEYSMLPLIELEEIDNLRIKDRVDPNNRINISGISEQKINSKYGYIEILTISFVDNNERDRFTDWAFRYPHTFDNLFRGDKTLYNIIYSDRKDFYKLAELLELSNVERVKLTLRNYPLPFSFKDEYTPEVLSPPSEIVAYGIKDILRQTYSYKNDVINITYYDMERISIRAFKNMISEKDFSRYFLSEDVIIHIDGDYDPDLFDFPYSLLPRKEKLDE